MQFNSVPLARQADGIQRDDVRQEEVNSSTEGEERASDVRERCSGETEKSNEE